MDSQIESSRPPPPHLGRAAPGLAILVVTSWLVGGCASLPGHAVGPSTDSMAAAMATPRSAGTAPEPRADTTGREVVRLPSRTAAVGDLRAVPRPPETLSAAFDVVTVHWGTDRRIPPAGRRAPDATPAGAKSTDTIETSSTRTAAAAPAANRSLLVAAALPGAERGDRLTLGRSAVTVPRIARAKGTLQRPREITFLDVTLYREDEDPRRHFTIATMEALDATTFAASASSQMAKGTRFKDQAFVFVHGFNMTFADALYRTAQIAYDLEFDGAAFMYSWPSRGEEAGYLYDRDSADRAQRYFREFLDTIAARTRARRVHVIAHSMGARPLLDILSAGSRTADAGRRLKLDQIVLAAPDIDRDVFVEIARTLGAAARGVTLYAADNDRALQASRTLARGTPRAGDVPTEGPIVVKGVDTIDISEAGTQALTALNHSTYADSAPILADMRLLMRAGTRPPDKRFAAFEPRTGTGGTYWRYVQR